MERLTYRNGNGYLFFRVEGKRVRIDDIETLRVAERLAHYEDAEEQGQLEFLPYKVGACVKGKHPKENWSGIVEEISINSEGVFLFCNSGGYHMYVRPEDVVAHDDGN